mmetsp:Transcript_6097/g.16131  ORF Transcript_6097/g.16131 Transcript_6097/m.16131 type:complete len:140 (+) Transcript_6097:43-462(+)
MSLHAISVDTAPAFSRVASGRRTRGSVGEARPKHDDEKTDQPKAKSTDGERRTQVAVPLVVRTRAEARAKAAVEENSSDSSSSDTEDSSSFNKKCGTMDTPGYNITRAERQAEKRANKREARSPPTWAPMTRRRAIDSA